MIPMAPREQPNAGLSHRSVTGWRRAKASPSPIGWERAGVRAASGLKGSIHHRPTFDVRRSAFDVRRSAFDVRCSVFGVRCWIRSVETSAPAFVHREAVMEISRGQRPRYWPKNASRRGAAAETPALGPPASRWQVCPTNHPTLDTVTQQTPPSESSQNFSLFAEERIPGNQLRALNPKTQARPRFPSPSPPQKEERAGVRGKVIQKTPRFELLI
jgi:hypothetical protein